jgi:hypothetical protein
MLRREIIAAVRAGKSLAGADLQKASLQGAYLHGASFQRADLREADLRRASLQEADLQRANLQEATLQEANLQKVNLQEANLQEADFYRASLQKANLQGADLQEADLRGADLQEANLQGANLLFMFASEAKTTGIKLSWVPKKGDLVRAYSDYSNADQSALGILLEDPDPDHLFNPISIRLHDKVVRRSIIDMKPASMLEEIIQEELATICRKQ